MQQRRKRQLNPDTVVLLKRIFTGVLAISFVSLLVTAVWYGTRVKILTINAVEVSGGETIKHEDVKTLVQQKLDGVYLGIVPLRFAWFYPYKEIYETLEGVDRIHNVTINRTNGTTLSISFDEYIPNSLWCESVGSDVCLFLDDFGYAFAPAPKLSGGSFLRFVLSGQSIKLNESFASSQIFNELLRLTKLLAEHNWFVSSVELDQVGDVFLHLSDGGELKVTIKRPSEEMVNNLIAVLASPEFAHLKPGNFQYIDLRFGDKVFVKEKETVSENIDSNIASSTISIASSTNELPE
jgi:cell division septal protein FtsQ